MGWEVAMTERHLPQPVENSAETVIEDVENWLHWILRHARTRYEYVSPDV